MKSVVPIMTVVGVILLVWIAAVIPMNIHLAADQAQRDEMVVAPATPAERQEVGSLSLAFQNPDVIPMTYVMERPRLPSPRQVWDELYSSVFEKKITSKRSLVYHGWVTLSATLLGFAIGTGLGILLAVGIVYSRTMDKSVMP